MADADAPALLEWLDLVDAEHVHEDLGDLADGASLLRVMHDLDPDGFPSPDVRFGRPGFCPPSEYATRLLEGLEALLHGRGAGRDEQICAHMLREAREGGQPDPVLLTKLVLVATIENDLPRRKHYIEKMLSLSVSAQESVRCIVERFQIGRGLESPSASSTPAGGSSRRAMQEPGFSPPSRSLSAMDATPKPLPDFMEVGLDPDSRFRRLKEQYISAMEEHERITEERSVLRRELEAERTKRREAEEAERVARVELKLAEEARDRMKEEQRSLFDLRLDQEVGHFKELLKEREYELEGMRDEIGLLQSQAAAADRLANQLEHAKQKIEEQQALRREHEEMKKQLEEVLTRPGGGGGDHLHRSLARAREETLAASRERDEANRQTELLRQEVAREQTARRRATEDLAAFRRQFGLPEGAQPSEGSGGAADPLAVQAGVALLAAAAAEGGAPQQSKSPKGASAQEIKLLKDQKDDLLERLLAEKERATRAETTMQVKVAEVASLMEQRMKDVGKIGALEAQLQSAQAQLDAARGDAAAAAARPASAASGAAAAAESSKVKELESALALRERELQVLQWRGQSESQALVAQETFVASCLHEVGLRYQKVLVQNQALKRRLKEAGPPAA